MIGWLLMLIEENNSELARTSLSTWTRETTTRSKHTWRWIQVEELLPLACSLPNHTTAAAGVKLLLCSKHPPSSNPADQLERQNINRRIGWRWARRATGPGCGAADLGDLGREGIRTATPPCSGRSRPRRHRGVSVLEHLALGGNRRRDPSRSPPSLARAESTRAYNPSPQPVPPLLAPPCPHFLPSRRLAASARAPQRDAAETAATSAHPPCSPAFFFFFFLLCVREEGRVFLEAARGLKQGGDGDRPRVPVQGAPPQEPQDHGRRRPRAGGGGRLGGVQGPVAALAAAAALRAFLRALPDAQRLAPQRRVQHVLPRLLRRRGHGRALLALPRARPPRPPHHPDPPLLLPRRHPGLRHPALHGHRRRADLRHQQRPRRLPQRAAPAAEARVRRQGRLRLRQPLRGLRPQPPRQLPLLLPRVQGHRLLPRRREGQELAPPGRRRRRRLRRQRLLLRPAECRQEAELHASHAAEHASEAAQGHPAPRAVRQPHRRVLALGGGGGGCIGITRAR